MEDEEAPAPKRGRGRPRKNPAQSGSNEPIAPKRGRGRPPKSVAPVESESDDDEDDESYASADLSTEQDSEAEISDPEPPAKRRGPGRPRKNPPPEEKEKRPVGRPRKNPEEPKNKTPATRARELARDNMQPWSPKSLLVPALTREAAERLLPDKYVDQSDLWTEDDEKRLQASWTSRDQAILDHHSSKSTSERPFWRLMLQLYKRHPYDLFKYGLKYDDSALGEMDVKGRGGQSFKCSNPGYLSRAICVQLELLLSHPIWDCDISLVRYLLQVAIMHRIPGHIAPIWPCAPDEVYFAMREEYLAKGQVEQANGLSLLAYKLSALDTRPEIRELCAIIEKIAQKDKPISRPDDGDLPREQVLFLLQHKDVTTIMEALALLKWNGCAKYRSCETYLEEYKRHLAGGNKGAFPPRELETLSQWKRDCALAVRRDWLVTQRRWVRDNGEDDESVVGYDIPSGDLAPVHFKSSLSDATEDHKRLMRGLIWPLVNAEPPRDWLEEDVSQGGLSE